MIEESEIKQLATLARIEMSEAEVEQMQKDLENILDYVSELNTVPTDDQKDLPAGNVLREDSEADLPGQYTKELLSEVPSVKNDFVKVKKILG